MSQLFFGIFMIIFGGAIINFGVVLQKRQINIRMKRKASINEQNSEGIVSFIKDPIWTLGILMQTILALPFLFIGLDNLGPSLAQPLSNACVIFLVLGLVYFLKEKLKKTEAFGIVILIIGMVLIGLAEVTGVTTLSIFLSNYVSTFWIFLAGVAGLIIGAFVLSKNGKIFLICYGLLIGLFNSLVTISMQIFLLSFEDLSLIIAKIMLIFGAIGFIMATVVAILLSQVAFKKGQAINIIPFSQITMNLVPILAGIIVFQQSIVNIMVFWIGTALIILGASLLARFQN